MKNNFFLLIIIVFFTACNDNKNNEYKIKYSEQPIFQKQIYIFGVHPLHNPHKLFEVYQPMVDYLNKNLKNIEIKLEASRNYDSYDKKLFNGYFDLSLPNPYQTIIAANKNYNIFGKMADDTNFRGIFIVRKDSNIKNIEDIKGKIVSYPAKTALAGTMLPQYYLYKNGININKDIQNHYVGSQESSIMNVYLKKSIIGATWTPPWLAFKKQNPDIAKELTIIWETQPLLNNALVARKDFPQDTLKKIENLIFNLHKNIEGKKILEKMELSHYEKADYHTYDKVREFLKKFDAQVRDIGEY